MQIVQLRLRARMRKNETYFRLALASLLAFRSDSLLAFTVGWGGPFLTV